MASCGLCHAVGMEFKGRLTTGEFWFSVQDSADQVRQSFADLPLLAPAQWSGSVMVGEWSFNRGPRGLIHGLPGGSTPFIHVMVSDNDAHDSALTLWGQNQGTHPRDKAEYYRSLENLDAESPQQHSMLMEGSWRDFEVWERENRGWAVVDGQEHCILLETENIDPSELTLVAVDDVEPYIADRNQWIRE